MLILIISSVLMLTGTIIWFMNTNLFIGFATGLGLGIVFIWLLLRKLGESAQTSVIAEELISRLLSYEASPYVIISHRTPEKGNGTDRKDIITALKGMGFTSTQAQEAADHALDTVSDDSPFEEKMREALKYLGNGHKNLVGSIKK